MSTVIYELENDVAENFCKKHITVYEDRIVLKVYGTVSNSDTQGEKTIYFADCKAARVKKGGVLIAGYLLMATDNGMSSSDGTSPYLSENGVAFRKSQNDIMEKIAVFINRQIRNLKNKNATTIEMPFSGEGVCKVCGNPIDDEMINCPSCFCKLKQDNPNDINIANIIRATRYAERADRIFPWLIISALVLAFGIILLLCDPGEAGGMDVGTCLKCWGKGMVENSYGVMVKCNNCLGGQVFYEKSSFGSTGIFGGIIASISGIATGILWNRWKYFKKLSQ